VTSGRSERFPFALKQRTSLSPRTQNLLLASLSEDNRSLILSQCVEVSLPLRTPMYVADEPLHYAYFLNSGFASVVASDSDGDTAEVGLIGREGVVGGGSSSGTGQSVDRVLHSTCGDGPEDERGKSTPRLSDIT
jgi:hypothetical protein